MDETDFTLTGKARVYLVRKLQEMQVKLTKLKRKRKIIKILYYLIITLSISINTVMITLLVTVGLPIYVLPILSVSSAILTGVSTKFNFEEKKIEISKTIDKIHKIKEKIDYIISCNGTFSVDEFKQIISDISIL